MPHHVRGVLAIFEVAFEVKTGKATVADLKAAISKASADIEELDAKISDLAGSNAGATKELEAATDLRKKELRSMPNY